MGFAIRVWTSKAGCTCTDGQIEVLGRLNPPLSFAVPCGALQNVKVDLLFQTVRSGTRDSHAFSLLTTAALDHDTSRTWGRPCSKQFLDPTS